MLVQAGAKRVPDSEYRERLAVQAVLVVEAAALLAEQLDLACRFPVAQLGSGLQSVLDQTRQPNLQASRPLESLPLLTFDIFESTSVQKLLNVFP